MNLSTLPDDVVLLILAELSPADLCRIGASCRRLRRLSISPALWQSHWSSCQTRQTSLGSKPEQQELEDISPSTPKRCPSPPCSPLLSPSGPPTDSRRAFLKRANHSHVWLAGHVTSCRHLTGHSAVVNSLDVSPESPGCVVSGSADRYVRLWDTGTASVTASLRVGTTVFFTRFVTPDLVAVGGSDSAVNLLSVHGRDGGGGGAGGLTVVSSLNGHSSSVYGLDTDGSLVVTASADSSLGIWKLPQSDLPDVIQPVGFLRGPHNSEAYCVGLDRSVSRIVSSGSCGVLRLFDLETLYPVSRTPIVEFGPSQMRCPVNTIQISHGLVMAGCDDGSLRLWDIRSGNHVISWLAHGDAVHTLQFDETKVVSGADDGAIVWDLRVHLSPLLSSRKSKSQHLSSYRLANVDTVRCVRFLDHRLFTASHTKVSMYDLGLW